MKAFYFIDFHSPHLDGSAVKLKSVHNVTSSVLSLEMEKFFLNIAIGLYMIGYNIIDLKRLILSLSTGDMVFYCP
ncbi:unnamed protein product [Heterobilharzia americana]|nr:unnamed protein product [Heterobilharzia americana]